MKKCCWGERPQKSPTCQQIGRAYLYGCITVSSNLSIHSVRSHRGGSIPHQCLNPIVLWLQTRLPFHLLSQPSRERVRSEEHTSELQSRENLVCRLLLEKKKKKNKTEEKYI